MILYGVTFFGQKKGKGPFVEWQLELNSEHSHMVYILYSYKVV